MKPGEVKRELRRLEKAMRDGDVKTLREAQARAGIAPYSRRKAVTDAVRQVLGYG